MSLDNAGWIQYLPEAARKRLTGRHQLQQAMSNTGWMMGGQLVRQGVGFAIAVMMARYLGPVLYGEFNYALAFATLFVPIGQLGLDSIVIRELVRNPSGRDTTLGTSFLLMVLGGLLAFGLAVLGISRLRNMDTLVFWLVVIMSAGTVFQAFNSIEFWLESRLQWKFTAIAKNSALLLGSLVKAGLILKHASLIAFAWTGLAEAAAGAAGLAVAYRANHLRLRSWRFNTCVAKKLLKGSWPLMLSGAASMVYLRIDQVMLGVLSEQMEVGIYAAAVRLAEASGFISMAVCSSVFPILVKADSADNAEFYAQLQRLYNLMALIAYCIAIPTTILSGWLIDMIYGQAYSKAGIVLATLVWSNLFTNLGAARTIYMISRNWTWAHFFCLLSGGLANIALNCFMIPRYGALGAAISSLISYWFAVQGSCMFFKPLHRIAWMQIRAMIYPKAW